MNAASVSLEDFYNAASKLPKMRSSKAGKKSRVPVDTIIKYTGGNILVDTPVICSKVTAEGDGDFEVSVHARALMEALAIHMRALERIQPGGVRLLIRVEKSEVLFQSLINDITKVESTTPILKNQ